MRSCQHLALPQAREQPLVGYPRLLIQYIRIYPPHWRLSPFLHPRPEDAPCRGDGETELLPEKPEGYFVYNTTQYKLDCDRPPGLRSDGMSRGVRMQKHCSDMQCIQCPYSPAPCVTVLHHSGVASHGSLDDHLTGSGSITTNESRTS